MLFILIFKVNSFFSFLGGMYEEYVWSGLRILGTGGSGSVCKSLGWSSLFLGFHFTIGFLFIWCGKWKIEGTASYFRCLFLIDSDSGRLEG